MDANHELVARSPRGPRFTRAAGRLAAAAAAVAALAVCVRLVFPAAARSEWLGEVVSTEAPCLLLAAASVIGLCSRHPLARRLAQTAAAAVLALGAAALLGAARGAELVSLPCAGALVLLGAAVLLAASRGSRRAFAAEVMACIAMATGMLAQLGHLYRVEDLYRLGRAPFEPWSALAVGLLGAAVLMARPGFALSRVVAGRMLGDVYLRRALPALLGIPIGAGMLGALGAHAGWWSEGAAFAVSTVVASAGLGVVGSVHARRLDGLAREQRRLEALFRRTFENAAVGIGHLDTQLRWLRANDRLCEILGRPREALLGRPALELSDGADRAAAREAYAAVAQAGAESRRFEQCVAGPGGELWTDVVLSAARDGDGEPAYLIAVVQDVTAHKRALAQVAAARAEAERAGRAKDDFFALISHELRSPLSAITNWLAVLRREAPPEVRARALLVLQRNVGLLARLIGDLLDASRIASGKLEIEREAFDLTEVVRGAVTALEPAARERDVLLRFAGAPPAAMLGDAERMDQVVRNLIENALKFTPAGRAVEVHLQRVGDQHQIVVRDEGEGIGPELLPHVFERFRQASSGARGAARGLGLGLSIVRHLVELHGGEVGAASDGAGRGAAFTVRIPAASGDATGREGATAGARDALEGLCVLVLEADRAIAEALAIALEDADAEVAWVQTAAEALAQRDVLKPQVVVADLDQMLAEASLLIRELNLLRDEGRLVASVALSTDGSLESRRVARDAGFDAYLVRPAEPAKLIALIASLAAQPDRICVVDDDAAFADSLALLLTRCGFEVERAYDAASALAVLERFRADVVITDLELGSASGAALAHALRERHGQRLRIVAATGRTPEEIGADAALFDAFVRKPVDLDALLAVVRGG